MSSVRGRVSGARVRVALGALTAGLLTVTVSACASSASGQPGSRSPLQREYEATINQALSSVVEITAGKLTGSGVVLDRHGDIVTNAHVVGSLKTFHVRVSVDSHPLKARLVGVFTPDDLAVIKVNKGSEDLKPVRWADSAQAQVGAIVLAVGSPYGLTDSVTQGIVSATGRTVTGPTISGQPPTVIRDAVQTSAAINPGNSGGALILLSGYVLGIPTFTARDPQLGGPAEGIGFAIPSNTVVDIGRQLINSGKVTKSDRASLDINGETHVNASGKPNGVTVVKATAGGAAASAGVHAGDVIVGVGGEPTPDVSALEGALVGYRPGEQAKLEVLRNGNPRQFTARLASLTS
jgi:putative serine protease PepD